MALCRNVVVVNVVVVIPTRSCSFLYRYPQSTDNNSRGMQPILNSEHLLFKFRTPTDSFSLSLFRSFFVRFCITLSDQLPLCKLCFSNAFQQNGLNTLTSRLNICIDCSVGFPYYGRHLLSFGSYASHKLKHTHTRRARNNKIHK